MVFKNESFAYIKAENIVAKGNIAQFEQYFLWQLCFQMSSAAMTDKSVPGCCRVKSIFTKLFETDEHKILLYKYSKTTMNSKVLCSKDIS